MRKLYKNVQTVFSYIKMYKLFSTSLIFNITTIYSIGLVV